MLTLILPSDIDGRETFERSFDFSKLPNLQEVRFGVRWRGGDLRSIPTALSTLRPATSPRLLAIRLGFTDPPASGRLFEPPIKLTGNVTNDVRRVVDEVARIELEFEGTLELVVHWGPRFHEVSNVRFHLC